MRKAVVSVRGGPIPDEVIDRVREHYDIVDVVGRYVQLKKSGRNYFGLCPFHSEKTPSFSVSPEKQMYYCFGCGAGGNVIKFIMEMEQMSFVEAVRHLAEEASIPLPRAGTLADSEDGPKKRMREALEWACRLYHHILLNTDQGRDAFRYLQDRGVSMETIKEFRLGFAPSSGNVLLRFLRRKGFSEKLLEEAGLVSSSESDPPRFFDRFRGRVMFPIHDFQGRVIAFGGRVIGDGHPKYLNSPETPLFHKGQHLFNLHRARRAIRKAREVVLFEGYMDVITAWQSGIQTGVASLGTSLSEGQARVIRRCAENVVICYDADDAGQAAADRGLDLLKDQGCLVKVAQMPPGTDPDDFLRKRGAEAFREEILAEALPLPAFKLEYLKKDFNLQDEGERMKYLTRALDVISDLSLAIERDHYLRRLADEFRLSLDALKQEQQRIWRRKKEKKRDKGGTKWNTEYHDAKHMVAHRRRPSAHEEAERQLVAMMMRDRSVAERVRETVGAEFHVDEYAAIVAYLYAYYAEGHPADPSRFIHYVKDERLMNCISELAMMDFPDSFSDEGIEDCIRMVRNYPLYKEMDTVKRQIEQAERAGDIAKAAQLGAELYRLKKRVQARS
ncbi:MAG: DNA primase [Planifilum fulgidum]